MAQEEVSLPSRGIESINFHLNPGFESQLHHCVTLGTLVNLSEPQVSVEITPSRLEEQMQYHISSTQNNAQPLLGTL